MYHPREATVNGMPVMARCTKCGREFLDAKPAPWFDGYRPSGRPHDNVCGGVVELTDAGRRYLDAATRAQ